MEGKTMKSESFSLHKHCMDFCQHLTSPHNMFHFSFSMATISFSLDTKQEATTVMPVGSKKSPAALKRNIRRWAEYLKKRAQPVPKTYSAAYIQKSVKTLAESRNVIKDISYFCLFFIFEKNQATFFF